MSNVTKVKENVRRITRNIEHDQAKRTEGCLTATCFFRYVFHRKNAREPTLRECPATCCYHPQYKPKLKGSRSSDVRSNHIMRRYSY